MKIITINTKEHNFVFVCNSEDTSSGFKHVCTLFINNIEQNTATCYYYNRNWEKYDFQTVCIKAIDNIINDYINKNIIAYKKLPIS